MSLCFLSARRGDERVIAVLRQRCWAAAYRGIYPDAMIDDYDHAWHEARDCARICSSRYIVRLIELDGQPVGYINLRMDEPPLLMSLYILPEYQRRGVGRAAFAHIREVFRERGKGTFICHCQPMNTPALAFYQRMGGVIVGQDTDNPEAWQDSVILRFGC